VLADGRAIRASESEHPDLFWALRGSACGLGVVSSFDFRLHEVAEVVGGLLIHPGAEAETVLRRFRDFAAGAPDEFCGLAVLTSAPPFPFLDAAWHGKPAVILELCWCGQPERGEQALAPLVQSPDVLGAHVGRMPYARWQKMLDPAAPPGRFNYWKTLNFSSLGDAEIGQLADAVLSLPTPVTEIHVQHLGGTVARAAPASTAFASREARFFVNLIGVALDADAFAAAREGVRALYSRLTPAAMASVMPNFTDRDDGAAAENTGSALAERLRRVRNRYDPTGVFAPR
jgi:FAD/FMN-containing dehydrogenase